MNSLQQQLLQAGLVDEKTAKQNQQQKYKQQKMARKNQIDQSALPASQIKQAAKEQREQARAQSRQQNAAIQQREKARELAAQVRDMLQNLQIKDASGELAYHFVDSQVGNSVKTIKVSERVQKSLASGSLCIGRLGADYVIIPRAIGEKIAARQQDAIIFATNTTACEDDYYAAFVVPDDLAW